MNTLQLTSRERATLIRSRFFARLPQSTVEDVLKSASVSAYEERDVLFRQDENVDDVFFVLSGLVRLCRMGKDGREADVALFPEGEMFAETAMFLKQRATASAVAAERSVIVRLDDVPGSGVASAKAVLSGRSREWISLPRRAS